MLRPEAVGSATSSISRHRPSIAACTASAVARPAGNCTRRWASNAAIGAASARQAFENFLPEDRKILAGISFGYPDVDLPPNSYRTTRAPMDEVVAWRSE
jgi:hypothetical protein